MYYADILYKYLLIRTIIDFYKVLGYNKVDHLKVPSTESTEGDKTSGIGFDKSLSGNFMITAIRHIFSTESASSEQVEYRMGLELSKDGVEEPVPYRKSRKED